MIGAGNLATQLGKALLGAGHDIVQVYSRTMESAKTLATLLGGSPTCSTDEIADTGEVYILALKDSVLGEIIPKVAKGREQKLLVHTAGSIPMEIFKGMVLHYGVLYPMQTFSKSRDVDFHTIPVFIEGNDDYSESMLMRMASSISGRVAHLSSEDRKHLHLSAVWACNFTNFCYDVASEILRRHNLPFDVMLPLVDETARKVHTLSPREAQTGPAVRYDENVIRAQSALMRENPLLKDIYERISLSIHRLSQEKKEEQS